MSQFIRCDVKKERLGEEMRNLIVSTSIPADEAHHRGVRRGQLLRFVSLVAPVVLLVELRGSSFKRRRVAKRLPGLASHPSTDVVICIHRRISASLQLSAHC